MQFRVYIATQIKLISSETFQMLRWLTGYLVFALSAFRSKLVPYLNITRPFCGQKTYILIHVARGETPASLPKDWIFGDDGHSEDYVVIENRALLPGDADRGFCGKCS